MKLIRISRVLVRKNNYTLFLNQNFEKVLVQNILHGLSPGLSDAINNISRWAFIKASFPHILHACAATLVYRRDNLQGFRLDKTETKLLYTLHWLILDAAGECMDNANQRQNKNKKIKKPINNSSSINSKGTNPYLHSVSTIQLFVYLFIPILSTLKPDDLNNLKLSNGLKIWEPLWAYRQPSIPIFNTPVKQRQQQQTADSQTIGAANPTPIVFIKTSDEDELLAGNRHSSLEKSGKTLLDVSHKNSVSIASSFGDIYMGEETRLVPGFRNSQELSVSRQDLNGNTQGKISFSRSSGCLSISGNSNCGSIGNKQHKLSISTDGTMSEINTIGE